MIWCEKRIHFSFGMIFIRSFSILTGIGLPWSDPADARCAGRAYPPPLRTQFQTLCPAPRWRSCAQRLARSEADPYRWGISPPKSVRILRAAPVTDLALLLKNPVDRISCASSSGCHRGEILNGRIFAEQAGRHLVDALVGALRRENGGHQQFPGIGMMQRAGDVRDTLYRARPEFS